MLATILFPIPLAVLSVAPLPHPTRDCQLEILNPSAIEEVALADFNAKVDLHVRLHRHLVRVSGAATIAESRMR